MRSWAFLIFFLAAASVHSADTGRGGFFFLNPLPEQEIARVGLAPEVVCAAGLSVARRRCSGVLVEGGYFVTARHCLPDANRPTVTEVTIWEKNGAKKHLAVSPTAFTNHIYPYDLSVYRVTSYAGRPVAKLRHDDPKDGETVFGIGFPWQGKRSNHLESTPESWDTMRVTFGQVVNANRDHGSICKFSNDVGNALPETWKLQADCAGTNRDGLGYNAREEKDVFFTDTDMTYGMSGSALFDREGRLLGIGTTILSRNPGDYDPARHAVYVKSSNLAKLLEMLHPTIKNMAPVFKASPMIELKAAAVKFE